MIDKEDLKFIQWVHNIFIKEGVAIICTGNYKNVNHELVKIIDEKIKKHPFIWKHFFMIK